MTTEITVTIGPPPPYSDDIVEKDPAEDNHLPPPPKYDHVDQIQQSTDQSLQRQQDPIADIIQRHNNQLPNDLVNRFIQFANANYSVELKPGHILVLDHLHENYRKYSDDAVVKAFAEMKRYMRMIYGIHYSLILYGIILLSAVPYNSYDHTCSDGSSYDCIDIKAFIISFHLVILPLFLLMSMIVVSGDATDPIFCRCEMIIPVSGYRGAMLLIGEWNFINFIVHWCILYEPSISLNDCNNNRSRLYNCHDNLFDHNKQYVDYLIYGIIVSVVTFVSVIKLAYYYNLRFT